MATKKTYEQYILDILDKKETELELYTALCEDYDILVTEIRNVLVSGKDAEGKIRHINKLLEYFDEEISLFKKKL